MHSSTRGTRCSGSSSLLRRATPPALGGLASPRLARAIAAAADPPSARQAHWDAEAHSCHPTRRGSNSSSLGSYKTLLTLAGQTRRISSPSAYTGTRPGEGYVPRAATVVSPNSEAGREVGGEAQVGEAASAGTTELSSTDPLDIYLSLVERGLVRKDEEQIRVMVKVRLFASNQEQQHAQAKWSMQMRSRGAASLSQRLT